MPMTFADVAQTSKSPLMPGIVKGILDDESEGGGNLLRFFDYETVDTLAPIFNKLVTEGPSSGVGTRPINGTFPEGTMTLIPDSVTLGEIGGDIKIDRTLLKVAYQPGMEPIALNIDAKTSLINRTANDKMVNGDRSTDPNGWNGIRKMVDPNQVLLMTDLDPTATGGIAIGPTATSATQKFFLRALDRLARMVGGPAVGGAKGTTAASNVAFLMNEPAQWALDWACRENNYLNQNEDQFGRTVLSYKGIPIMNPGSKNAVETYKDSYSDTNAVLPNNRYAGTNSDGMEIYAIRKGDPLRGLCIVQLSPLETEVVTEHMEAGPAKLIRMSWNLALWRPKKANIAVLKGFRANT